MQITTHPDRFLHIQICDKNPKIPRIFTDVHHFVAFVLAFCDGHDLFIMTIISVLFVFGFFFLVQCVFASVYSRIALLHVAFYDFLSGYFECVCSTMCIKSCCLLTLQLIQFVVDFVVVVIVGLCCSYDACFFFASSLLLACSLSLCACYFTYIHRVCVTSRPIYLRLCQRQ